MRDPVLRLIDEWLKRLKPRPAPRRRRARLRDHQRSRVYRWEAAHALPHATEPLSLEGCRELVEAVFRWAEAPGADPHWQPPRVTDGRGRRHAAGSRGVIKLPRWARNRGIVLHECAHGLSTDGHGPGFVAAYLRLLAHFAGLPEAELRASLAPFGVKAGPAVARRPRSRPGKVPA